MGLIYSVIHSTLMALRRQCPKCHHKQITAPGKAAVVVPCARCGSEIPPQSAGRRGPAKARE